MLEKIFNPNNISNLITIMSVCIGAYITYMFNNIAEKRKFKKEQNREIYKLIKKSFYCTKKTLRNIIEAGSNEEECIEYAKQYNLISQKLLEDYREENPTHTWKIMLVFNKELMDLKMPSISSKYECVYLDEIFNVCKEETVFFSISPVKSENPTDYYSLDFFSLKILGTLLPYNEFVEFKKIINLEESNKFKVNLNKCFNKRKFNFLKELKELSFLINKQILLVNEYRSEIRNILSNQNWIIDAETGHDIIEDFDRKKFILVYREKYHIFFMSILDLMKLHNKVIKIFYKYFYYI